MDVIYVRKRKIAIWEIEQITFEMKKCEKTNYPMRERESEKNLPFISYDDLYCRLTKKAAGDGKGERARKWAGNEIKRQK